MSPILRPGWRCPAPALWRLILMVAAGADVQHPALRRHRPDHAMSLDKGVSHRDSLAKYAAAFFRMSRSIRALANSLETQRQQIVGYAMSKRLNDESKPGASSASPHAISP